MHPRISLHQVAFMDATTAEFLAHCRSIGVSKATLVTPKLVKPSELEAARNSGVAIACVNHVFGAYPDLERDEGEATRNLDAAIATAASLGAPAIYLISGGRGALDWEAAAARFAEQIAPCLRAAKDAGIALLVENASPLNADIHIAHTLNDALALAEMARIGVCLDLHACWFESVIAERIANAMPRVGLIQVSDYVLGDRATPCRAVPGDGVIPIERLVGAALDAGYSGLFDLELVGPRIASEGAVNASLRATEALSVILTRLGA